MKRPKYPLLLLSLYIRGEFIRFLIIGILTFAVDYGVFALALGHMNSDSGYLFRHSLSSGLGFVLSFTLNRIWVFRSKGKLLFQLLKYCCLFGVNLVLSNAVLFALIHSLKVNPNFSKLGVIAFITVWNFVIYKAVVYNDSFLTRNLSRFPVRDSRS